MSSRSERPDLLRDGDGDGCARVAGLRTVLRSVRALRAPVGLVALQSVRAIRVPRRVRAGARRHAAVGRRDGGSGFVVESGARARDPGEPTRHGIRRVRYRIRHRLVPRQRGHGHPLRRLHSRARRALGRLAAPGLADPVLHASVHGAERRAAMTTPDDMVREFFLGFIKVHILHHAAEEEVYGLALIAELRRHGYELSPGKMYPVLHELEEAGYLRRIDRVVNGKIRKYYAITRRGAAALTDAREKIGELVGELLAAGAPAHRPKTAGRGKRR